MDTKEENINLRKQLLQTSIKLAMAETYAQSSLINMNISVRKMQGDIETFKRKVSKQNLSEIKEVHKLRKEATEVVNLMSGIIKEKLQEQQHASLHC